MKGLKDKKTGRLIRNLKDINCGFCGKLFHPRFEKRIYCSKKCTSNPITKLKMSISAKKRGPSFLGRKHTLESKLKNSLAHRGEKNTNWAGGMTSLIRKIRRGIKYRNWRASVYSRDNWTCVWCGGSRKYLNADHIIQLAFLLRKNNIKTVEEAEGCNELWIIDNGRTLCIECHKKTDTYLNKGKQSLKNLVENAK